MHDPCGQRLRNAKTLITLQRKRQIRPKMRYANAIVCQLFPLYMPFLFISYLLLLHRNHKHNHKQKASESRRYSIAWEIVSFSVSSKPISTHNHKSRLQITISPVRLNNSSLIKQHFLWIE